MPFMAMQQTPGRMLIRSDAVGQRVRVYWADEDEWFSGQVQDADDAQGYFVLYDDGDERWESLAQRVEFEEGGEYRQQQQQHCRDEEESDTEEGEGQQQQLQEQQHGGGRAPEMMEPPASPTDDAYDDDAYDERDAAERHEDKRGLDALGEDAAGGSASERDDGDEDLEKIDLATAGIARPAFRLQEDDGDGSNASESEDQQQGDDDDGEQSVAMSAVPITFERGAGGGNHSSARSSAHPLTARSSSSSRTAGVSNTGVNLPVHGILRGKVLRASHLASIPTTPEKTPTRSNRRLITPPRAFVKIAFVEAAAGENPKHANVMLRCKNALASTSVATQSNHPVWNDEDGNGGGCGAEADGAFQMQLVPPVKSPKEPPAWLQLRGDVLFSVYSVSTGVGSDDEEDEEEKRERGRRRRHVHDFIGQAVLSLRELLRDVLFGGSMSLTRHLPLQSRQDKPLVAHSSSRTRNAFEDVGGDDEDETSIVMAPEIVVSFEFKPTYLEAIRQRVTTRSKFTGQNSRSLTKDRGPNASARSLASQPKSKDQYPKQLATAASKLKAQAKKTTRTSSTINRRKFEKQVDQQNVAFAKRLEWQDQRRARLSEHAKAQAKSKQPIPQHGTMKLDHKASSGVNRTKFQQQVRQENRAMEKRLHAIIIKDAAGKERQHKGGGGAKDHEGVTEFSDVGFDDLDKDKVLARDRRHHKLREQDFLMARAQAKYQQQNQVVEKVTKLQGELAELKTQVFNAKAAVNRLGILNNKNQHLCKCLRSAAESSPSVVNSNGSGGNRSVKRKTAKQEEYGDDTSGDAGVTRQRKELELLKKEAAGLYSEKQRLSQALRTCNQQEQELDDEIHRLTSQLRFMQKKQAFQLRMSSRAGAELQFTKEMKKKQQLLELSKDDEELWALYQAQQELTQLQIAVQVLKERSASATSSNSANPSSSSSSVACEYLETKIERQKQKLEQLEQEQSHFQREYELLLVSGEQETLRRHVHELQQTLFLCQTQQKHARAAQKHANYADEKLTMEFQTKVFQEQTETEILFKKKSER